MKILYVDLDDTIRKGPGAGHCFVNGPEDVVLFEGVAEKLKAYSVAGWRIAGVSNQGGIAMGHTTYERVRQAMCRTNELSGYIFDSILWCPHHPSAEDPDMRECCCRKPRYGMIAASNIFNSLRQNNKLYLKAYKSLFVGDMETDRLCAEAACVPFMWAQEWRDTPVEDLL